MLYICYMKKILAIIGLVFLFSCSEPKEVSTDTRVQRYEYYDPFYNDPWYYNDPFYRNYYHRYDHYYPTYRYHYYQQPYRKYPDGIYRRH